MVDDPVLTLEEHIAWIWNLIWPRARTCLAMCIHCFRVIMFYALRFFMRIVSFLVTYRDQQTATRVATLGVYRYATLGNHEIRLLKLSKSTPWGLVRCELIPVVLEEAPPFETISYTWGAQAASKSLILDKKRFLVSERVYDIVHARASCLMTRYIWIDSICINQGDDEEKSTQVRSMRNIYGSSYHTVVWLGYAPDATDAMGFLAHLRRRIDSDDPVERASRPLYDLNIENPSWPAFTRLVQHDYWSRCWVIQEIAVSRKVIIAYGGELVTWDYFSSLIEMLFGDDANSVWHISKIHGRGSDPLPFPMDAGLQIASLVRMRHHIRTKRSLGLLDLLIMSINFTASDARDTIYALQGISTAADSGEVAPDYSHTIEHSFLTTAEYLLNQDHASRMLHLAGIGFHRNPELRTSWVPDWTTKRLAGMFWRDPTLSPCRASGSVDRGPAMTVGPDGLTLSLGGVIMVDHIKKAGPRFFGVSENGVPKTARFPGNFKHYADSRDMVMNGELLNEPYVTGISLTEAFWRTMTGDRTETHTRPADPAFYAHYQAWERFLEALRGWCGPDMDVDPLERANMGSVEEQERLNSLVAGSLIGMGRFANVSGPHTRERMFAITTRGYMGMVPPYSKVGDAVCIISGVQVPFLLRRRSDTGNVDDPSCGSWQLVGESYFQGMMDGEMMAEGHAEQTIQLC